jgi:RNA polymerase sigma factor (sigma-70 family)
MIAKVGPIRGDPSVTDLVTRARKGEQQAWDLIIERYAPLVWSICRKHRLGSADANDVGQNVWLHLVEQLDKIRDPAALPGWLATTTRHECLRAMRQARRPQAAGYLLDVENIPDQQGGTVEDELLQAECHAALREAFTHLPPSCQQLLTLLMADPPIPYAEISARLGIPVGSIGPTRNRCLDKLRRYPAVAALINAEAGRAEQMPAQAGEAQRTQRPRPAVHAGVADTGTPVTWRRSASTSMSSRSATTEAPRAVVGSDGDGAVYGALVRS